MSTLTPIEIASICADQIIADLSESDQLKRAWNSMDVTACHNTYVRWRDIILKGLLSAEKNRDRVF